MQTQTSPMLSQVQQAEEGTVVLSAFCEQIALNELAGAAGIQSPKLLGLLAKLMKASWLDPYESFGRREQARLIKPHQLFDSVGRLSATLKIHGYEATDGSGSVPLTNWLSMLVGVGKNFKRATDMAMAGRRIEPTAEVYRPNFSGRGTPKTQVAATA